MFIFTITTDIKKDRELMPLSAVLAVRNGRVPDAANQVNECGALTLTGLGYNQGRRPGGQTGGNIGTNWGAGTAP